MGKREHCSIGAGRRPATGRGDFAEQLAAADARTGLVCTRPIRDAAMTRRHVVAWHKEKYLTASMRRFITLCRSAAEEVEKQ